MICITNAAFDRQPVYAHSAAAMGARTVEIVTSYNHGETPIDEYDVVLFSDEGVPLNAKNAKRIATKQWLKECLVSHRGL